MAILTAENYKQGFLIDDDLMAGVSPHPDNAEQFLAYVLHHTTGEYLGYQPFAELDQALGAINRIPRTWVFEKAGGCGGCGEGRGGKCSKGQCGAGKCGTAGSGTCPI
jgi:hypothetical protein